MPLRMDTDTHRALLHKTETHFVAYSSIHATLASALKIMTVQGVLMYAFHTFSAYSEAATGSLPANPCCV